MLWTKRIEGPNRVAKGDARVIATWMIPHVRHQGKCRKGGAKCVNGGDFFVNGYLVTFWCW